MQKTNYTLNEIKEEMLKHSKITMEHLINFLKQNNCYRELTYYDEDCAQEKYFLLYTKNGFAKIPVLDVFNGNGGHRLNLVNAEMLNKEDVIKLKEAKRDVKKDLDELNTFLEKKQTSIIPVDLTIMDFVFELEDYKEHNEETLSMVVEENTRLDDERDILLNISLKDDKYLGYFLIVLKDNPALVPYYAYKEDSGGEQIDLGGIRYIEEKDKAYLKKAIEKLKKDASIIDLALEKQKLREIFK